MTAAPEGWQLVPVEPTEAMLNAAIAGQSFPQDFGADWQGKALQHAAKIYRAMLAAELNTQREALSAHGGSTDAGAQGLPTPPSFEGLEKREEVIAKPLTYKDPASEVEARYEREKAGGVSVRACG